MIQVSVFDLLGGKELVTKCFRLVKELGVEDNTRELFF
jgi:hypothetical protein